MIRPPTNKIIFGSLLGILVAELLFIFVFLLNYDLSWMNPEKFGTHGWILSNGYQWHKEDWSKFLNIDVIEYNPDRLSRPLSNFMEVVDSKFRAWSWHHIIPHPSLSLAWPFMFVLLPYLLYLALVNLGCNPGLALTAACIYIASVGFLGPLVMLFHPAKNLVNFFTVLALFLFSLPYKKIPDTPSPLSNRWALWLGFAVLYLGFISDETGLFAYLIAVVIFYRLWCHLWQSKDYISLAGLISLPLVYLLTIKILLPELHWLIRHKAVHLNNYESYPSVKDLFLPNWPNLWENTKLLFSDHPHWWFNYSKLAVHPVLWSIQVIYLILYIWILTAGGKTLFKKQPQIRGKKFLGLTCLGLGLMLAYCFFQTFQLSKNAKIWGIWWYGSLFSLIYVLTLVFFLQFLLLNRQALLKWIPLLAIVFVVHGMAFSTYRIAMIKNQNLNRDRFKFQDIFKEKFDVYQYFNFGTALNRSSCKEFYTYLFWQKWRGRQISVNPKRLDSCRTLMSGDIYFPIENLYLYMELK